jgi:hypothetical protein
MTSEERKNYYKKYREKNRERLKEQRLNRIRLQALEDMESVKNQTVDVHVIHTSQGGEYHIRA